MSLTIIGDRPFKTSVANAINEICPCSMFSVDAAGTVKRARSRKSCTCYCKHRAGCNLVQSLDGARMDFKIAISQGDALYLGASKTVLWNPTRQGFDLNDDGSIGCIPSIVLAHEQAHAFVDLLRTTPSMEEHFAVRAENQVRRDIAHPLRTAHSSNSVPQHDMPVLSTKDNEECCRRDARARRVDDRKRRLEELLSDTEPAASPFEGELSHIHSYVAGQYMRAIRRRSQAAHLPYIDRLEDRFLNAQFAARLEMVGIAGEFRVIWLAILEDGITLVSNLSLNESRTRPFVGELGALIEYRLALDSALSRAAQEIVHHSFDPGVGGDERTADGAFDLLSVQGSGETRRTGLYGYAYEALHGVWAAPEDALHRGRWDAITATLALWRQLMLARREDADVIAAPAAPY